MTQSPSRDSTLHTHMIAHMSSNGPNTSEYVRLQKLCTNISRKHPPSPSPRIPCREHCYEIVYLLPEWKQEKKTRLTAAAGEKAKDVKIRSFPRFRHFMPYIRYLTSDIFVMSRTPRNPSSSDPATNTALSPSSKV